MKKIITVLLIIGMIFTVLSGCTRDRAVLNNGKYKIVTTSFSAFDWAKNIIGDNTDLFSLELIGDNGTDMHSYQPTAADIVSINESDLFIYVGSSGDEWAEDVMENSDKDIKAIKMLEAVGSAVLEEEEALEDDHNHNRYEERKASQNYDGHIWLSLKNAVAVSGEIAKEMSLIDSENSQKYDKNREEYEGRLLAVYNKYSEEFKNKKDKPLIFADRFPFRYLIEEFDLEYYACFSGCSTETEASFDSVVFLADKINEFGIKSLLVTEDSDKKIAKTVISNTKEKNQEILALNSMQSVTAKRIKDGLDYISVMEENLKLLIKALD